MATTQIPSLPPFFNMQYTDDKGNLTVNAQLFNDLTYQILTQVVEYFNAGLQLPRKTTAEITIYINDINIPNGTLWFNTTLGKLQFKTGAGTFQTVTST
jgi:hypothetical protein